MLSVPAYATDRDWVDAPLTEALCKWAPAAGIHLYHFPLSLDSQKVRQGLEELGLAWQSHVILLPAQQQFELDLRGGSDPELSVRKNGIFWYGFSFFIFATAGT